MDQIAGVMGAGAMGSGIAQVAAMAGWKVVLYDANSQAVSRSLKNLQSSLEKLEAKNKITADESKKVLSGIIPAGSLSSFAECALVIEAVIEDITVKKNLFAELEKQVGKNCILATNTSSLSVTSIASACNHPEKFIGIHFFNPAVLMPLAEIIPGFRTDENIYKEADRIIKSWGKTTVKAKDTPGFIVNRVARPYYGEAIRLLEEQIAGVEEIDAAMRNAGFKMGPFELMDLIGNDINYTVTETVWRQMFFDERYKPSQTQKRMVEAGLLGKKTGRGYYNYQDTEVKKSSPSSGGQFIFSRIICMLINEACDALHYGIASRDDIDLAMTKGVNYPKGLLQWCDEMGAENVLATMHELLDLYNEPRYRPSVLLKEMVAEKKKFY